MPNPGKIFLGTTDICGQLSDFSKEYKLLGYKTFTYVYSDVNNYDRSYDFVLSNIYPSFLNHKQLMYFRKAYSLFIVIPVDYIMLFWAALYFDVFHFMWFKHRNLKLYLRFLRLLNKKIIVSFVGSDIRWVPLWIQELDYRGLPHAPTKTLLENNSKNSITLNSQLRYVRVFEKYSNIIFSVPEQAQLQLKPYYNFYLPVDLKSIDFKIASNPKLLVSIGVTEPNFKNSRILVETISGFRKGREEIFDLVIIENRSHKEVLEILSNSDIFIYSPYVAGPGKFGMEAMAAGALLLTGYDADWIKYPPNPPFITTTPSNILEKLEYYLINKEERINIVIKARAYALRYSDSKIIAENVLKNLLNPHSIPEYFPTFFREKATFDNSSDYSNAVDTCNKWTRYTSKCSWYAENVKQGTRAGLIF